MKYLKVKNIWVIVFKDSFISILIYGGFEEVVVLLIGFEYIDLIRGFIILYLFLIILFLVIYEELVC